ncbi:MAG: leucine-rich repeat domain-containing protein [Firmicutes bacterium]|nr:leucine-rich repeat domain-containing protein [Bacillota bacterium]
MKDQIIMTDGDTHIIIPSYIIGRRITTIREHAFDGVHYSNNLYIQSIVIPNSILTIYDNAFSGLINLNTIYSAGSMPPQIGIMTFSGMVLRNVRLNVPTGSRSNYLMRGWYIFSDIRERSDFLTWSQALVVNFDAQYINIEGIKTRIIKEGEEFGDLPNLYGMKQGYIFNGWWTQPNGEGVRVWNHHIAGEAGEIMLYARWDVRRPGIRPI